jgi:hypothetical protein
MTDNHTSNQNLLRTISLTALLVGTVGSLYFMFSAGSKQKSILLIVLFTGWVVSPFVGLFIANRISNRWTGSTRSTIYWLILVLSICSLIAYSGTLTPPDTKPAFMFLAVPFVSWFLIVTVFLIVKRTSNKNA